MKRYLCLLLCALVLTGCAGEPSHIINDVEEAEPIRIVATLQTSSPTSEAPVLTAVQIGRAHV